jgi:DNA-binding PadR family transcriptional regulator
VPTSPELPLTEWVVLALVDEEPRHGFAVARELGPGAPVGRVWTVSRSLSYRAVDQLLAKAMIAPAREERSGTGPTRTILAPTAAGRRAVRRWLVEPVEHFRDVRSELLVKLVLLERAGRDRAALVDAQLAAFAPRFASLGSRPPDASDAEGAVDRWRWESAAAVRRLLQSL